MFSDMLLGQYVDTDSVVHRLWAGTKLVATIALAVALVMLRWTPGYFICFGLLVAVILVARLPVGYLWRSSWLFLTILGTGSLMTLFFAQGDDPTRSVFGLFTVEGARRSHRIFSMFALILLNAKVLIMTTRTVDLIDALAVLLAPLKRLRAPVDEIVMTTALSLRFIPLLSDEISKLLRAQQARSSIARSDIGGQAQNFMAMVLPLLNSNLERADELATAMEARGYAGGAWVMPTPVRLRTADRIVLVAILTLSVALVSTLWYSKLWPS